MTDTSDEDVVYHGCHQGSLGASVVAVQTETGQQVGVLRHVIYHSADGFTWGYRGSGPADLARSLLIAALGEGARCPTCAGTAKMVYRCELPTEEPYDPHRLADYDPTRVHPCIDCDDGYRPLPYRSFERECVAHWGNHWRIRRGDIRAWLAARAAIA